MSPLSSPLETGYFAFMAIGHKGVQGMNRKTLMMLSSFFFSYAVSADQGLVRDARGRAVLTHHNTCVIQVGADPKAAAEACKVVMGKTEMRRAPVVTVPLHLDAHFDTNDALLSEEDAERISDAVRSTGAKAPVVVRGYTDFRGTEEHNKELAERRADAAKEVLVQSGIPDHLIEVETQAPAAPRSASPCANLKGETLARCLSGDRKVEIQIQAR
jgi:outer membrane protein OmpA-like peptidoglycan-associated protein